MVVIDFKTGREIRYVSGNFHVRTREREQLSQEDLPMMFQVGMDGTSYGNTETLLILDEGDESEEQE